MYVDRKRFGGTRHALDFIPDLEELQVGTLPFLNVCVIIPTKAFVYILIQARTQTSDERHGNKKRRTSLFCDHGFEYSGARAFPTRKEDHANFFHPALQYVHSL